MSNLIVTQGYGGVGQFGVVSVVCTTPTQVTVTFNGDVVLSGAADEAASWSIDPGLGAAAVSVQAVQSTTSQVILTTTQHTDAGSYILHLPDTIFDTGGRPLASDLDQPYTGVGTFPVVQIVKSIDEFTIDIVFSKPMFEEDALDPSNYSVATGVTVLSVEKFTDLDYHLVTTAHVENTAYSLSATGIRDIYLNPVQP